MNDEHWELIRAEAERAYPAECCGLILGTEAACRVRPCANAQNKYHELDPESFPRDERKAYFIEPRELLAVHRELAASGERILAIYHSHPDADAYFSAEDQKRALAEGEPVYPGAKYLVLSVRKAKTVACKWFTWDGRGYEEDSSVESF